MSAFATSSRIASALALSKLSTLMYRRFFALLSAYVFATITLQVNAHRLCWIMVECKKT
jgi:hypothetical protein